MSYEDSSTALVPGASAGSGCAAGHNLSEQGLTVHAVARDRQRLSALAEEAGAIPHPLDLSDTAAVEAEIGSLDIDVLVNNAGVSRQGNVLSSTRQDLDDMVDVNVRDVLQ